MGGIMETSAFTSWLQIMACPGKYLVLDQFNGSFTYFIFAKISFAIDHKLRDPVGMHGEQIDQLLGFQFSVQVHNSISRSFFTNTMRGLPFVLKRNYKSNDTIKGGIFFSNNYRSLRNI